MEVELLKRLNESFKNKNLKEAFDALIQLNLGKMAFSSSFGQEDQVLTYL